MSAPLADPIKIVAKRVGDVRIHTFLSSFADDNIANATHIVESRNALVLIDGQFLVPYAQQFREYADSLGKPIDRLYLSHRHPDHWFGLGVAFSDVAIYALPETISFLEQNGKASIADHGRLGDLAPKPDSLVIPQNAAKPGVETIDGITYIFERVVDTEIDYLLSIRLPELGVYITQDLLYSGTHLYLTKYIEHWIWTLEPMLASDYELFMPGHGLPADKNEVARNIEYLSSAKHAMDNGLALENDAFKNFLIQRYPERKCPGIFDIYLPRLFSGASDF